MSKKKRKKTARSAKAPRAAHASRGASPRMKGLIHLLIILSLGLVLYSNTLESPFQWDEEPLIENNPIVRNLGYFLNPSGAAEFGTYDAFVGRYVSYLTFALNYRLHGLDVTGYHVFNVGVHLLNALLVYWLVLLTLRTPFLAGSALSGYARHMAFFAGLFFVSHPLQTEAVTYIFQRHASLAAFFCLLSLVSYARGRLGGGAAFYAISFISAVLAMKTKENAFTLPLVALIYEFMFFGGRARERLLRLLPMLLTMLIVPMTIILKRPAGEGVGGAARAVVEYATLSGEKTEYLFTQFRVVVTYLRLLVLPVGQNLDYDYPVYGSFFEPQVALSFIFLLGVFCAGVYLLLRSRAAEPGLRLAAFGIFWFFITLSVESSIIPIPMVINEYRVYLPGVGFFLAGLTALFLAAERLKARWPYSVKLLMAGAVTAVLALSVAAYARNAVWRSEISLWGDASAKSPQKARPHIHLGLAYDEGGMYEEALRVYRYTLEIDPLNDEVHYNIGVVYGKMGMDEEAESRYRTALRLNPHNHNAHNNLGIIYNGRGLREEAAREFQAALKTNPSNVIALNNLGTLYLGMGRYREAEEVFRAARKFVPESAGLHNRLGVAYMRQGRYAEAAGEFEAAIKGDPGNETYKGNLKLIKDLTKKDRGP